jgi:hypothetical protein
MGGAAVDVILFVKGMWFYGFLHSGSLTPLGSIL